MRQEVQLMVEEEQVAHSPAQAMATPEMFTYPSGVVARQAELCSTYPASQERQVEIVEQLAQWRLDTVLHREHTPNPMFS